MKFSPGDIIGSTGLISGIVIYSDIKSKTYGLRSVNDHNNYVYKWKWKTAHQTYEVHVPDYVPEAQKKKWIKERRKKNGRYKDTMCKPSV